VEELAGYGHLNPPQLVSFQASTTTPLIRRFTCREFLAFWMRYTAILAPSIGTK
jgi:hypothetical protein